MRFAESFLFNLDVTLKGDPLGLLFVFKLKSIIRKHTNRLLNRRR